MQRLRLSLKRFNPPYPLKTVCDQELFDQLLSDPEYIQIHANTDCVITDYLTGCKLLEVRREASLGFDFQDCNQVIARLGRLKKSTSTKIRRGGQHMYGFCDSSMPTGEPFEQRLVDGKLRKLRAPVLYASHKCNMAPFEELIRPKVNQMWSLFSEEEPTMSKYMADTDYSFPAGTGFDKVIVACNGQSPLHLDSGDMPDTPTVMLWLYAGSNLGGALILPDRKVIILPANNTVTWFQSSQLLHMNGPMSRHCSKVSIMCNRSNDIWNYERSHPYCKECTPT